jgi:Flp pilus assembly protein TadG
MSFPTLFKRISRHPGLRRLGRHLTAVPGMSDVRGSAAVEFGIIGPAFIMVILFLMIVGYVMVMKQSLNYATQKAARLIATGQVQAAQLTQAQFIQQDICPLLPSLFTCANVIVNIQPVTTGDTSYPNEYYKFLNASSTGLSMPPLSNNSTSYCPGNAGGYVYMQVVYPISLPGGLFSNILTTTTYNGANVYVISATATFLNEPFTAPVGGC